MPSVFARFHALGFFLALLLSGPAQAFDLRDFTCSDDQGRPAVLVESLLISDAATAVLGEGNQPKIYFNPSLFRFFFGKAASKSVLLFVLTHECGHFQGGAERIAKKIPDSLATEIAADVWAVRELYNKGFTDEQFEEVYAAFEPIAAQDHLHLGGPERVAVLRAALSDFKRGR